MVKYIYGQLGIYYVHFMSFYVQTSIRTKNHLQLKKFSDMKFVPHELVSFSILFGELLGSPYSGGAQIWKLLCRCEEQKSWGAQNFFSFKIIILDIFCEHLGYVAPTL